jgi:hypothetical protein
MVDNNAIYSYCFNIYHEVTDKKKEYEYIKTRFPSIKKNDIIKIVDEEKNQYIRHWDDTPEPGCPSFDQNFHPFFYCYTTRDWSFDHISSIYEKLSLSTLQLGTKWNMDYYQIDNFKIGKNKYQLILFLDNSFPCRRFSDLENMIRRKTRFIFKLNEWIFDDYFFRFKKRLFLLY